MVAITDAYATPAEYKARHEKQGSDTDAVIQRQLKANSRYIDSLTHGRIFSRNASAVARVFVPTQAKPELHVDDFVSVTSITIDTDNDGSFADETALDSGDYELLPRNAALEPIAKPYRTIRLTEYGNQVTWPVGSRVQITAVWGWPSAVPDAIKYAVIDLTALDRGEADENLDREQIETRVMREFGLVTL